MDFHWTLTDQWYSGDRLCCSCTGRTLATLDINLNLESPDGLKPSQFGWGEEVQKDDAEAAKVIDPEKSEDDSSNATQSEP